LQALSLTRVVNLRNRPLHHLGTAGGMYIKHPDAEPKGFNTRSSDRVRYVVEFQVKKDPHPVRREFPYEIGARRGKKLHPDLERTDSVPQFGNQLASPLGAVNV